MEEKEKKSNILFEKAMECYNRNDYEEALKYFEACIKYFPNSRAELFIKVCKNNIPSKSNSNSNQSNYHSSNSNSNTNNSYQSYSHQNSKSSQPPYTNNNTNTTNDNNNNTNSNNSNTTSNEAQSDDEKCKQLLKKKDYYDLLNISKSATQEEIKRGYKKQAVRFHPDKNHSKLAEECFKKISEAYQTLSNPEKKEFYDKYGDEAEFREKYYQTHQAYEEEMDAFDIFDILFGGDPNFQRRAGQRRRRYRQADFTHNNNNINLAGRGGYLMLMQFLPVIFMLILFVIPNLSSFFEAKPLYQFKRDSLYSHRRKTSINQVEFYVGEEFIKKYPKMKDFQNLEPDIEKEYLSYVYQECRNAISRKNTYEYYMTYSYNRYEREMYRQKLSQLDYNSCEKYNRLKDYIR